MNRRIVILVFAVALAGAALRSVFAENPGIPFMHGRWSSNTVSVVTVTTGPAVALTSNNNSRAYLRVIEVSSSTNSVTNFFGQTALNTSSINYQDVLLTSGGSLTYPNNTGGGTRPDDPLFVSVYSPASTSTFVVIEGTKQQ